ncbi:MAG: AAA family ATPase [Acidimicrobiia bacterium]
MDHQHEGLKLKQYRRRSAPWDRIKVLLALSVIFLFMAWVKMSDPFLSFREAVTETARGGFGRFLVILMGLEVLRQIHYLISEHWSGYHRFWKSRIFEGTERQITNRVSEWTRYRVRRIFKWLLLLALYVTLVMTFVSDVESPVEAIVRAPEIIGRFLSFAMLLVFYFFIIVVQFVGIFWFLSRGGVDVYYPEDIETRFDQVWGQDHVLDLVKESIAFLEKPDEIEEKGGYIPGGILLWGPPGTGKTLMAEAIAGEVGKPYVFVDPGAFINMFMGVGILKVKSLFRKLRKLSLKFGGVIVFFDEADSLGNRGALAGGQGPWQPSIGKALTACNGFEYLSDASRDTLYHMLAGAESTPAPPRNPIHRIIMGGGMGGGGMGTLQALLSEMSGLKKPRGITNRLRRLLGMRPKPPPKYRILIMLATNMPQALDEAMLRPGRIDRIYKVPYPSKDGRVRTLQGYLDKVSNVVTPEQVERLAVMTPYYSGAKIKDLVNEGLILAIRDGREVVGYDDLWRAKALKELGPPEDVQYIQRERHAVAVHESCHAVAAHLLQAHRAIDVVTIEKHSQALGMVKPLPVEDRYTEWKSEYETDIKVSLASLAGERMFFGGDSSSGVSGDLENASRLVALMEGAWGMGEEVTSLYLASGYLLQRGKDPTELVIRERGAQVEARLKRLYDEVWDLLERHRHDVERLASVLEEKKTISGDEVAEILQVPAGIYADGEHLHRDDQLSLPVFSGDGQEADGESSGTD